ncbi:PLASMODESMATA CALLOSE-BINDING PROTEIN 1 [Nicotiana tabacum]|uniref:PLASMODESMATA CALLOSE-BINDING PROTEIN 1 n=1 Tax=Nicotiana tabacum TaxID=4097 RepID=A0A1S4DIA1_TOBAC|nr:PREDICTED: PLASMODESMATA CALLOSE-BINDING PROTEIN 3-like [Nicotiana tabacum]
MAAFMLSLVFFLAITGHSSASYCVCKDGVDEKILQENIDYACGSGADCTAIHQGGACYNPDTIKDHCSYAVNSYYQRKGGSGASCDFKGTATLSSNAPSSTSGCVYQSTAGGGSTTPTTGTTNPSTGGTGTSTSTGTGTGMGTGTGTTTTGTNPVFGLGPTGSGMTDTSAGTTTLHQSSSIFCTMALLFTSFVYLRV